MLFQLYFPYDVLTTLCSMTQTQMATYYRVLKYLYFYDFSLKNHYKAKKSSLNEQEIQTY